MQNWAAAPKNEVNFFLRFSSVEPIFAELFLAH